MPPVWAAAVSARCVPCPSAAAALCRGVQQDGEGSPCGPAPWFWAGFGKNSCSQGASRRLRRACGELASLPLARGAASNIVRVLCLCFVRSASLAVAFYVLTDSSGISRIPASTSISTPRKPLTNELLLSSIPVNKRAHAGLAGSGEGSEGWRTRRAGSRSRRLPAVPPCVSAPSPFKGRLFPLVEKASLLLNPRITSRCPLGLSFWGGRGQVALRAVSAWCGAAGRAKGGHPMRAQC